MHNATESLPQLRIASPDRLLRKAWRPLLARLVLGALVAFAAGPPCSGETDVLEGMGGEGEPGEATEAEDPGEHLLSSEAEAERQKDLLNLRHSVLLQREISPKPGEKDGQKVDLVVPAAGTYQLWLRHRFEVKIRRPFGAHVRNGDRQTTLDYADYRVDVPEMGSRIEKRLGLRFDASKDRIGAVTGSTMVWQAKSINLDPGPLQFYVEAKPSSPGGQPLLVDMAFLTASKTYLPTSEDFIKTQLRFRLLKSDPPDAAVTAAVGLTYHTLHVSRRYPLGIWYGSAGTMARKAGPVPFGEYSDWLDISEIIISGGGYVTGFLGFSPGLRSYRVELQMAWFPHEAAVLKTVETESYAFWIPVNPGPPAATDFPAKLMRNTDWLGRFRTAEDVAETHRQWIKEAALPDVPLPKKMRFYTGCSVPAEQAALRELGINAFDGFGGAQDALFYAGSHCPNRPDVPDNIDRFVKASIKAVPADQDWRYSLGDEIGAITYDSHIAMCSDCSRLYRDFVRKWGYSAEDFGLASLDELGFGPLTGAGNSRSARLAQFLSRRFLIDNSLSFYRTFTQAIARHRPRCRTSVNYTPHGDLMASGGMQAMDWFTLCREGGLRYGWAEDWLWGWGYYGFGGPQAESYYASLVTASVRPHRDMPWGFYLVVNSGDVERKVLSLVSRRPHTIDMYAFGPAYLGADMSNFWSEIPGCYAQVGRALRRVGPADDILYDGKPAPAQAALLYNRYHEIWQKDNAMTYERELLFFALMHAQVPVDIVIEDDLTAEGLKPYKALYLTGENLVERNAQAIRQWVEAGGSLWAHAGAGARDHVDAKLSTLDDVFGCTQRFVRREAENYHVNAIPGRKPVDTIEFSDNELFSARSVPAIGWKAVLKPTTGQVIGRYADGSPAAVMNTFGKGTAVLVGSLPGCAYRHPAGTKPPIVGYRANEREVIVAQALKAVQRPVEVSEPLVETHLIEAPQGIAVTLNNFRFEDIGELKVGVRTDRTFDEISSSDRGKLDWKKTDRGIELSLPLGVADIVTLRSGKAE